MRLVNYGPGEITDRLTILSLKILHGELAHKETAHWQAEASALLAMIRTRTLNGSWFQQMLQLGAVNAALWTAEDELRAVRKLARGVEELSTESCVRVAGIAFRIQELNDLRAQLVEAINKLTGDHVGQEKL